MSISLCFWSLKPRLDGQCSLQKVERSSHLTNASIVASHIVESHCLSKLVGFTKLLGLSEQIKGGIDVFFLQIVDSENVTDFT